MALTAFGYHCLLVKAAALGIYMGEISAPHKGFCIVDSISIGLIAKVVKSRAIGIAQCCVGQTIQAFGQLLSAHIHHLAQYRITPLWVTCYGKYMAMVCSYNNQGFVWVAVVHCGLNSTGKLYRICQSIVGAVGMVTMINTPRLNQQKISFGVFIKNI